MKNVIFDMETQDPDDFLTLCWLASHPKINLVGVTVTPGTQEQIGIVVQIFQKLGKEKPLIGGYDPLRIEGCVSEFHYNLFVKKQSSPDDIGARILKLCLVEYPDATLLTGGPLKNLHQFLTFPESKINHWVCQGGFAGINVVKPEHVLSKFAGRETCPTFNFNGDPQGALLALSSKQISQRTLVSKNVCHGISYTQEFHEEFKPHKDRNSGMNLIYSAMEIYLKRHPKGKMLHDPLAACVMMNPDICTFEEVEVYRLKGEWGSRKATNTKTKISVAVDFSKFKESFIYQK